MKKAKLLKKICKMANIPTQADAEQLLNVIFTELTEILKDGGSITLPNFGTFSVEEDVDRRAKPRKDYIFVDPPMRNVVRFSPSKSLEQAVLCGIFSEKTNNGISV